MFHTVIEAGATARSSTGRQDQQDVHAGGGAGQARQPLQRSRLGRPRMAARWHNAVQRLAAETPHGIPVTISTDRGTRLSRTWAPGSPPVRSRSGPSRWARGRAGPALVRGSPTSPGRSTWRSASAQPCTHPRPRHRAAVGEAGAHVRAGPARGHRAGPGVLAGPRAGPSSARKRRLHRQALSGWRAAEGRRGCPLPLRPRQIYGEGRFDDDLSPFPVLEAGVAAVMPYYGMPVDLVVDGEEIEQVGFGYNRQVVTGMLRERLGYEGVVLTDWELVNDNHVGDQVLPSAVVGRRAPRPARADGADPARRVRPVRRRGVRRRPARPRARRPGDRGARRRVRATAPAGEVPARAVRRPVRRRGGRGGHGRAGGLPGPRACRRERPR